MSSMFKKKGGLAFKPKIPSARPRPAAPATNVPVTKSVESEAIVDTTAEAPATEIQDHPTNTIIASDPDKPNLTEPAESSVAASKPRSQDAAASSEHQKQTFHAEPQSTIAETPTIESSTQGDSITTNTTTRAELAPSEPHRPVPRAEKIASAIPDDHIAPELRDEQHPTQDTYGSVPEQTPNTDRPQESSEEITPAATPAPQTAQPAAPKPRTRRKASSAVTQTDGGEDAEARPKKRQRKTAQEGDGATTPKPRQRKTSTQNGTPGQTKRARSVTPEDAETQTVDLQKLKMTDLTKDLHIGKKFSRHDELRERERQSRVRAKLKKNGGDASREESETPETPAADKSEKSKSATPVASSTPAPAATSGPQFRIVDGQIIVDQSSLVMDRHARAAAARQDMETVEENDFTRLITSSSFMNTSKLKGPNIWTDEETELFYRGLRMFGTEFEMISKMFPNKQRRHVKLKFNREERHCPQRINAVLIGEKTVRLDIDEYKAFTGIEFESVESIEAEQRKIQEDFEAEQKRIADEQAEIMRKKREELFADEEGNEDGATGKKKKKGKKKGKQTVQYGLNGEPIIPEDS